MATLGAGCGADAATDFVVRDSAGVAIAHSGDPVWADGESWRLSDEPLVSIGVRDGAPEYQLFHALPAWLEDGRIAVANGGTNEVRLYDPEGRFVSSFGSSGEGPGEFRSLATVRPLGPDSLLAYDLALQRISIFGTSGEFARSFTLVSAEGRQILPRGLLQDGSLLVLESRRYDAPDARTGVVRDSVHYFRYSLEGALQDTLMLLPSLEVYRLVHGESWRLTTLAFAVQPSLAVGPAHLHFGPADRPEIQIFSPAGDLIRVFRWEQPPRPVREADVRAHRRARLQRAAREGGSEVMERMLDEMPVKEVMPAYGTVRVDAEGHTWVQEYRTRAEEEGPSLWKVFDPEGRWLGAVIMPPRFEPVEIGRDRVLGRWRDDLDVEHVQVYGLERRG